MKRVWTPVFVFAALLYVINGLSTERPSSHLNVPILMYHAIGQYDGNPGAAPEYYVSPELFEAHLDALEQSGYTAITLEALISHWLGGEKLPEKPVVITFDDGYDNMYSEAFPLLAEKGFSATFFIFTDIIGTDIGLTESEILEMRQGGMEIGSHSVTHSDLASLSGERLGNEFTASKSILEKITGYEVRSLSYPHGRRNAAVVKAAGEAGYTAAVTTEYGFALKGASVFNLPRIGVIAGDSAETILFKLSVLGF